MRLSEPRSATVRARPHHAPPSSSNALSCHATAGGGLARAVPRRWQHVACSMPEAVTAPASASAAAATAKPVPEPGQPQPQPSTSSSKPKDDPSDSPATALGGFHLSRVHVAIFALIFACGALCATLTLQFTADMEFSTAVMTVLTRVTKSAAFRQLVVIAVAILAVRYCLNGALKTIANFTNSRVEWDKTLAFYILREVYQPLELLLLIAAICTVADTFVPSLISVSKSTVSRVVKTILSTSFILGFSSVIFNIKSRFCKENGWQAEMKGDVTRQRRWEAYDKLGTFVIYVMTFVLAIQAIGLEVTSVLAIGGIGGLAIGLAGREICENLLNGFLIMSTNPFEVGDEIHFFHSSKVVEGFVIDIGWYRTLIRSFEREVFVIPNSVFSKNIVLNITRKNREFRFFETLLIRVQDVQKTNQIIQDIRRIVRGDPRTIQKLHRRVFLDKITQEDCRIYISFYLEAANRDAFMAIKQDMILSFVDVVERNGAKLATPRTMVDMDKDLAEAIGGVGPMLAGIASMQQGLKANKRLAEVHSMPPGSIAEAEAMTVSASGTGAGSGGNGGSDGSSGGVGAGSAAGSAGASGAPSSPIMGGGGANGNGAATSGAAPGQPKSPGKPPAPMSAPSGHTQPGSSGTSASPSQSVPALPLSSSPVAFSSIQQGLPKASSSKGTSPPPTSESPQPEQNHWRSQQQQSQSFQSASLTSDMLLASFEDLNTMFENSVNYTDADNYEDALYRREALDEVPKRDNAASR